VNSLRQGYIHEIRMAGVKSASGESLLHDFGYYTVNQIPAGKALAVKPAANVTQSAMATNSTTSSAAVRSAAATAKHQTTMPADWNGTVDQTVSVQGVEGLKFSLPSFDVKPGARVKLDFANTSDMLHNLVIVRPGAGTKVGEAALKLGLDGQKLDYVPKTDDVLFNTSLLEPQKVESIYFVAPTAPGEYQYVCTFPGHYVTMQGTMRVIR
jgi:azurin